MDSNNPETAAETTSALLTKNEARVLASLMEKELTVPDNYPLTLNSLTLACNQKSNREPQMSLPEGEVGHIAKTLRERGFVRIEYGERAQKYEHTARKAMTIDKKQQALLTVMMLRAPQTLNELKVRSKRMVEFEDNSEILSMLESLNEFGELRMLHIPRGAGQREDRYTHLLCGEVEKTQNKAKAAPAAYKENSGLDAMQAKIDALTERIETLEEKLN